MEHESIYYYFTHQRSGHTLVLAICAGGFVRGSPAMPASPISSRKAVWWKTRTASTAEGRLGRHHAPACIAWMTTIFTRNARLLEPAESASFARDKAEVFDWPGRYTDHAHGQFLRSRCANRSSKLQHEQMSGESGSQGIAAPGYRFQLIRRRAEDNRAYLVNWRVTSCGKTATPTTITTLANNIPNFRWCRRTSSAGARRTRPGRKPAGHQTAESGWPGRQASGPINMAG